GGADLFGQSVVGVAERLGCCSALGHGGRGELVGGVVAQAGHGWCLGIGLLGPGGNQPPGLVVAVDELRNRRGAILIGDLQQIIVLQGHTVTTLYGLPVGAALGCFTQRVPVVGVGERA